LTGKIIAKIRDGMLPCGLRVPDAAAVDFVTENIQVL
jgi:hypothetical protein